MNRSKSQNSLQANGMIMKTQMQVIFRNNENDDFHDEILMIFN
ncbi:hypothetical protein [Shewanella schlegeliana]|nr:hypothetical protein [Shewanella schlegeliana]